MKAPGTAGLRVAGLSVGVVASVGLFLASSSVAFAYPKPTGQHHIVCTPGQVNAQNGSCQVIFTDRDAEGVAVAGQQVCFTVKGPGTVQPTCSTTDSSGRAQATYSTGSYPGDCTKASRPTRKTVAVIYGQETGSRADEAGAAKTTVELRCPAPPRPSDSGRGAAGASSGGAPTAGSSTRPTAARGIDAHTAAAVLDPAGATGLVPSWMLGGGIVAIAALLAVAMAGRLRLRRFRA